MERRDEGAGREVRGGGRSREKMIRGKKKGRKNIMDGGRNREKIKEERRKVGRR